MTNPWQVKPIFFSASNHVVIQQFSFEGSYIATLRPKNSKVEITHPRISLNILHVYLVPVFMINVGFIQSLSSPYFVAKQSCLRWNQYSFKWNHSSPIYTSVVAVFIYVHIITKSLATFGWIFIRMNYIHKLRHKNIPTYTGKIWEKKLNLEGHWLHYNIWLVLFRFESTENSGTLKKYKCFLV